MRILTALILLFASTSVFAASGTTTSNGDLETVTCKSGILNVAIAGTYGTATVTLEYDHDVAGFEAVDEAIFNSSSTKNQVKVEWGAGETFRLSVSGVTTGTDLDWSLLCQPVR